MAATNQVSQQTQPIPPSPRPQHPPVQPAPAPAPQNPPSGGTSPAPRPNRTDGDIILCGSPRSYDPYNYELGYCDGTARPCGVANPGSQPLLMTPAARFQAPGRPTPMTPERAREMLAQLQPPARPSSPSSSSSSNSDTWSTIAGLIFCLGGLNPLCMTGCASEPPRPIPEIPDGSAPPSNADPCAQLRDTIVNNDPFNAARGTVAAEFQRRYPGITFPITLTYPAGVLLDSNGNPVTTVTIRPEDIVTFQETPSHQLYLVANPRQGEAYVPSVMPFWNVSGSAPTPIITNDIARNGTGPSNVITLSYFHALAASMPVGGGQIDIVFDPLLNRGAAEIDPATGERLPLSALISTVNPNDLNGRVLYGDYVCAPPADGGADGGRDASADVPSDRMDGGAGTDAASDADAGPMSDARMDARPDASVDARSDAADVTGDGRADAMADSRTDAPRRDAGADVPRRG